MGICKNIVVMPIKCDVAREFVKKYHYSGKVVANSCLHLGAFLDGRLGGVMQFGASLDKKKIQRLVDGTGWSQFLELNRMAFCDYLPRNSESRCLAVAMRLIRKNYPHIKWIVSFADGAQCGDGTIYRASGFVLTGIKRVSAETGSGTAFYRLPNGKSFCNLTVKMNGYSGDLAKCCTPEMFDQYIGTHWSDVKRLNALVKAIGGKCIDGFSLRYIYFLDRSYLPRLTVPVLPFSAIDEAGARMYKGVKKQ